MALDVVLQIHKHVFFLCVSGVELESLLWW